MSHHHARSLACLALALAPAAAAAQTAIPDQAASAVPGQRLARGAELAGEAVAAFPHFVPRRTFQEGEPIEVAVDPTRFPDVVGTTARIFVVEARTHAEWLQDRTLVDVTGAVETVVLGPTLAGNVVVADAGTLAGGAGVDLAVGYDVVVDLDGDGFLSATDLIDGGADEPGLSIARDPSLPGPFGVTEVIYDLSGAQWDEQNLYYPTQIAALGELPVVILSHGNGQSYLWFDALGTHLASHGFLVVAHATSTGAGAVSAGISTIGNTEAFLKSHGSIAGGALAGHVDASRIAWMGLTRGGEGIVIAAAGLAIGTYAADAFGPADVRALVAVSPSDLHAASPGAKPFALIDGGAGPFCPLQAGESFRLHDRGDGPRRSFYVQGGSSSHLHGSGPPVGEGPCPLAPADVQALVAGYLVPLFAHDLRGEVGVRDFLTRPWDAFQPLSAPAGPCVEVQKSYRAAGSGLVIDDYQTAPSLALASSGALVTTNLSDLVEDRLDDPDVDLTPAAGEPMNAMTYAGPLDGSRGAVLSYADDRFLAFDLGAPHDARGYAALAFRACQRSRHPLTAAELGPLDLTVAIEDQSGASASVRLSALSAGITEPYQRSGCGDGVGWINVLQTVRIPLEAFQGVDRSQVRTVRFLLGPSHGSPVGALGLDEVELTPER